ncbi:MAG TPA: ornithine carbamoyltransferase [Micromonosporaceae bacterium]|nr:ornithine carbamoyltransferase [Micromonosporaceae bacterium]
MIKHFLRDDDLSPAEQDQVLSLKPGRALEGKSVAVIFEKPSLRTRVSFEVGISQLGGTPVIVDAITTHFGRGESMADAARALSRYVAAIVIRTGADARIVELAEYASVPVVNALTDGFHPCQVLADLLTIRQHLGNTAGRTLAYLGDGDNNMANSYLLGGATAGMHVRIAAPTEFTPATSIVERADVIAAHTGGSVTLLTDPFEAVSGVDVVATDTWTSMGMENDGIDRITPFLPYQINGALLKETPNAIVLHCLPAHRGEEITDEVMDGPQSVVFDQTENRLHAQKSLLAFLIGAQA